MNPKVSENALRDAYAKTALARMGVPIERAMQIEAVRVAVEGSARAMGRAETVARGGVADAA